MDQIQYCQQLLQQVAAEVHFSQVVRRNQAVRVVVV
jgi:hypothetical protein